MCSLILLLLQKIFFCHVISFCCVNIFHVVILCLVTSENNMSWEFYIHLALKSFYCGDFLCSYEYIYFVVKILVLSWKFFFWENIWNSSCWTQVANQINCNKKLIDILGLSRSAFLFCGKQDCRLGLQWGET